MDIEVFVRSLLSGVTQIRYFERPSELLCDGICQLKDAIEAVILVQKLAPRTPIELQKVAITLRSEPISSQECLQLPQINFSTKYRNTFTEQFFMKKLSLRNKFSKYIHKSFQKWPFLVQVGSKAQQPPRSPIKGHFWRREYGPSNCTSRSQRKPSSENIPPRRGGSWGWPYKGNSLFRHSAIILRHQRH